MKEQNFKNHSRLSLGWHGFTAFSIIALIIGSTINVFKSCEGNIYSAALLLLISVVLLFTWFFARVFALKAQDRVIRLEENLRAQSLSGKPLSKGLHIRQIIGLRFASDEEFLALADRAEKEKLTEKEIKMAIVNWRADYYRV